MKRKIVALVFLGGLWAFSAQADPMYADGGCGSSPNPFGCANTGNENQGDGCTKVEWTCRDRGGIYTVIDTVCANGDCYRWSAGAY